MEGLLLSQMLSSPAKKKLISAKKNLISAYVSLPLFWIAAAPVAVDLALYLSVAVHFFSWLPQELLPQKNLRLASAMAVGLSVAVYFFSWLPHELDVSVVVKVRVHVVWVSVHVSVQQDIVSVEVEFWGL